MWNPSKPVSISTTMLHDQVGYTPYEGMQITGWPEDVLSRGRSVVHAGELKAARGSGEFIARGRPMLPEKSAAAEVSAGRGAFSKLEGLVSDA